MAALLAAVMAGVLFLGALGGTVTLAVTVGLVQVVLLVGIARASDVPAARVSGAVALVAGLAAVGFVAAEPAEREAGEALWPLVGAAGLGFVAMVAVQLARRDGRDRLTTSLTLGVTALLLAVVAATWVGLRGDEAGTAVGLLALAGAGTGAAITAFPGPRWLWAVGGVVAAASVGLLVQSYLPLVTDAGLAAGTAALIAGACGLATIGAMWVTRLVDDDRLEAGDHVPVLPSAMVAAALPVVLAAPVALGCAWAVAEGYAA